MKFQYCKNACRYIGNIGTEIANILIFFAKIGTMLAKYNSLIY